MKIKWDPEGYTWDGKPLKIQDYMAQIRMPDGTIATLPVEADKNGNLRVVIDVHGFKTENSVEFFEFISLTPDPFFVPPPPLMDFEKVTILEAGLRKILWWRAEGATDLHRQAKFMAEEAEETLVAAQCLTTPCKGPPAPGL